MKITHQYKNTKINKKTDEDVGLLLGNNLGNYFYLTNKEETRYQGFFYADEKSYKNELTVYKIIDRIEILNKSEVEEIKNEFFQVERKYKDGLTEKYFLPDNLNSLCLKTNKKVRAKIVLDMRHPYDSRQMGRFYDVQIKKDYVIIRFVKRRDWQEDGLGDKKEFVLYLVIKTDRDEYKKIDKFSLKHYEKDKKRNSYPADRYVYESVEIEFKNAVFSISKNLEKATKEVEKTFDSFEKLQKKEKNAKYKKLNLPKIKDKEIKMAHLCAQNSVLTLMVENNNQNGVFAGLPWFFQFWSRDEAVSLLQIYKLNKSLAQKIILSQLKSVLYNGQLNKQRSHGAEFSIDSGLQSADTLGWIADQVLKISEKYHIPKDFEMDIVKGFEKAAYNLIKNRTENDLSINFKHETWMDSVEREGARIEVQACRLRIYSLLYKLTKNEQYKILIRDLKNEVIKKFYLDNQTLSDGSDDKTIRSNIFLAAYLYPQLLEEDRWKNCFDETLKKLYLEWGGISSIDKTDKRFIKNDTGENSASYHNGNSWYWVNNLTAFVLYASDSRKYSEYINAIMEVSTNEILYKGIAGHHSEVSSAESQTSSGCGAQLWSAAMYLEVFDEILR